MDYGNMVQQRLFAQVLHTDTDTLSIKDHHHRIHFTPLRFSGLCEMNIICGKMLLHAHATTNEPKQTADKTQNITPDRDHFTNIRGPFHHDPGYLERLQVAGVELRTVTSAWRT